MKIDDANRLASTQATDRAQPTGSQPAAGKKGAPRQDETQISDLAQALGGANNQRIEALRQAVQSGRYQVSPPELANSIIQQHLKP